MLSIKDAYRCIVYTPSELYASENALHKVCLV